MSSVADVCPMIEGSIDADGDELLIKDSCQCLPRYLVHFKRVPKRRTNQSEPIPIEMRNAEVIVLWLDPEAKVSKSPITLVCSLVLIATLRKLWSLATRDGPSRLLT